MRIFLTGGSGLTGPSVVHELISAGHEVTGLARSAAAAARLQALGARVLPGSLDDLGTLRRGADEAEGVIHMAFGGDFSDRESMRRRDVAAIEAMGSALAGSNKPFVSTSGTLVMKQGHVSVETDPPDAGSLAAFRVAGEDACLACAERGVRAAVLRLAPTVHGPGDVGFIPMLIAAARRTGISAYIDAGANRWPAVHRLDAAVLYRLVLEKAPAGTAWHGAAEGAVDFKAIATQIGEQLGLPVRSISAAEALAHFGNPFFAMVFGLDVPVSSEHTQRELGWTPTHPTLLADLRHGDYFSEAAASKFAATH